MIKQWILEFRAGFSDKAKSVLCVQSFFLDMTTFSVAPLAVTQGLRRRRDENS
jgi:hypothetical protein